jgi:poly(3-hydroxyoctanoate) depolymerase
MILVLALFALFATAHGQESRCTQTPERIECTFNQIRLEKCDPLSIARRQVTYQTPLGVPPREGWPVVFFFQGTGFNPGDWLWEAGINYPFGAYYQAEVIKRLLDNNYTVIAPFAHAAGRLFWDTNVPVCATAWQTCPDSCLMDQLHSLFSEGVFGPIDEGNVFATGISSGGYMTSRMAEAYNDPLSPIEGIYRFKALAISAGSWCTCVGLLCDVPEPRNLPSNHPPTLFLHGEDDFTVPINTAL